MRESFDYRAQLTIVLRQLHEQQAAPVKVRASYLGYLVALLREMDSFAFDQADANGGRLAVADIVRSLSDKNADVKRLAAQALVSLFALNAAEVSSMLSQLTPLERDAAQRVLNNNVATAGTPRTPTGPQLVRPHNLFLDHGAGESDVHRGLRETMHQINAYCGNGTGGVLHANNAAKGGSQDSGIVDANDLAQSVSDAVYVILAAESHGRLVDCATCSVAYAVG